MRTLLIIATFLSFVVDSNAGDGIGGTNRYKTDFSQEHALYKTTKDDERWTASLLRKFKTTNKAVYFVRTDLALTKDGKELRGLVYRRVDQPSYYYVSEGDVMFDLKERFIYNPGVGGFSMHSPKSRDFIVCLNFQKSGVPFLRHSEIMKSNVWWFTRGEFNRLDN